MELNEDLLLANDSSLLFGPLVDVEVVRFVLLLLLLFSRDDCSEPNEIMPADQSPPSRVAPRPVPISPDNKLCPTALAASEPLPLVVVVFLDANGMMSRMVGLKKFSCWVACASSSPITIMRQTGHVACFENNFKFKTRFRKK